MKISRQARNTARKLFTLCRKAEGGIDEKRVRAVIDYVTRQKPRHAVGIMERFRQLVELEQDRVSTTIESAHTLGGEEQRQLTKALEAAFGPDLKVAFKEDASLLGGLRIRRGSTVWDGSIRGRLAELRKHF